MSPQSEFWQRIHCPLEIGNQNWFAAKSLRCVMLVPPYCSWALSLEHRQMSTAQPLLSITYERCVLFLLMGKAAATSNAVLNPTLNGSTAAKNCDRLMVPSRTRCHHRNNRLSRRNNPDPICFETPVRSAMAVKSRFRCAQQTCRCFTFNQL